MKIRKLNWVAAAIAALVVPFRTASALETATLVGSETCIACHSEQAASFNSSTHGKKISVTKTVGADKTCETCHGAGSLHAAAAGDKTNVGFGTIKNPAKADSKTVAKACFTCHKEKAVMLWSTSSHAQTGMTCNKCHSVHTGQGPNNLKKSANETCFQCHTKQKTESKLPSHHPLEEGKMECVSCHNPHGGPVGNLKAESVNETCFKCHSEKAGPFANEHSPVAENCNNCHKPHGSVNEALLKQPQPYLCMSCHNKNDHALHTTNQPIGTLNTGNVNTYQRCTNCHRDIHGGNIRASFRN